PSSVATCWLSAGCAICNTSAAWVRLPISTIFTKYFRRLKFMLPPVFKNRPKCRHYLQPESKMLASSILALMRKLTNCQIKDYDRFVIGPFYQQSHSPAL